MYLKESWNKEVKLLNQHVLNLRKKKKIQAIQSHQLITSVAELDALVANITSLSIPKSLQDAELRELVYKITKAIAYTGI